MAPSTPPAVECDAGLIAAMRANEFAEAEAEHNRNDPTIQVCQFHFIVSQPTVSFRRLCCHTCEIVAARPRGKFGDSRRREYSAAAAIAASAAASAAAAAAAVVQRGDSDAAWREDSVDAQRQRATNVLTTTSS